MTLDVEIQHMDQLGITIYYDVWVKRPAEASTIIELPMAGQLITVKWPTSDPEGCAQFIRAVAQ
ncbi:MULTISPECIES: hypothetical protein [Pseudomonas]|uniref:hypothetical protein n=1 Tax=Pseudomonas TaxID=286 RepID=UPI00190B3D76|nr:MULTISPECIES: hypothetical protein [unclassified Pseudomonas]MBK3431600.1 hypothetical protein [Pseudomonas fluorescens]MBK3483682.1 hypothetical protein [Pseudomonas fluorescens]MEB0191517.1 hypothetical protein [Pseudomonas sp. CCI1.1]WPX46133.1 hypothetical protein RHM69_17410 [Pseudomonas sp. CCI1.1]